MSSAPAATSRAGYLALAAMLFAVAMTFIDQTIVAIASPSIPKGIAAETWIMLLRVTRGSGGLTCIGPIAGG